MKSAGVRTFDALSGGVTMALLACVALAASYVPVRRALAIDPARALRYE